MKIRSLTLTQVLVVLITLGSILRLFVCFEHNPLDSIFSDPARHWTNGENLFHPNLMGASDPILYQIFVFLIQKITGEQRLLVAGVYGLLSILMPWTFYRAARALGLAKNPSLAVWALIAWMPSLFVIFHYIMMETLLLTLEGFSLWMTGRYLRKGSHGSFLIAVLCWALACLTKTTAIPIAIICLSYAWLMRSRQFFQALSALFLVAVLLIPNSIRTYHHLGFVAPVGGLWIQKILHRSDAKHIEIFSNKGHWKFSSPSCYIEPLEPLSPWIIHRAEGDEVVTIHIDLNHGQRDWIEAYENLPMDFKLWFRQLKENALLFFFAPSWPDSNTSEWDGWLNYQLRWIWAPLIFVIFELNFGEFWKRRFDLIPILVTLLTLILAFQNTVDMEGRYRKILEPLLLLNLVWVLRRPTDLTDPAAGTVSVLPELRVSKRV